MPGLLPAGEYHLTTAGYQADKNAHLHADILLRHTGAADRVIASAESGTVADAGLPGDIDAVLSAGEVPAVCGDLLVVKLTMTVGTSPYIELFTRVSIP